MSRLTGIATTCDIDRDPEQNTRNHQAMIDRVNALIGEDGWPGVKVEAFYTAAGLSVLQVEPGASPLTLDYLRRLKEAGQPNPTETPPAVAGEQGRLV